DPATAPARPPSRGWANATFGVSSLTPPAARLVPVKNGDAAASGWTAEHTSWRNPGSVSSSVRQPPPRVPAPPRTWTARPAPASVSAAASPFGPEPTTTASAFPARLLGPTPHPPPLPPSLPPSLAPPSLVTRSQAPSLLSPGGATPLGSLLAPGATLVTGRPPGRADPGPPVPLRISGFLPSSGNRSQVSSISPSVSRPRIRARPTPRRPALRAAAGRPRHGRGAEASERALRPGEQRDLVAMSEGCAAHGPGVRAAGVQQRPAGRARLGHRDAAVARLAVPPGPDRRPDAQGRGHQQHPVPDDCDPAPLPRP